MNGTMPAYAVNQNAPLLWRKETVAALGLGRLFAFTINDRNSGACAAIVAQQRWLPGSYVAFR